MIDAESAPHFHVVLYEPKIPPNTGNIGRLCVGTGCRLHLVEPLGFSITEKAVRRAGLDYWQDLDLSVHSSWEELAGGPSWDPDRAWFFTTKVRRPFTAVTPRPGDFLVFGPETTGLPETMIDAHRGRAVTLPMFGPVRSLNLSNAVSVAVYQGLERLFPAAFVHDEPGGSFD